MKQKTKFDFLAINRRMNGNWNCGDSPFIGQKNWLNRTW